MSKNIRIVLIILVRLLTDIIIQTGLFIQIVFFYDYSVKSVIVWVIIGVVLIIIDHYACIRILGDKNILVPWIVHIADLVLAVPNIALLVYIFILDVVNRDIINPHYSVYDIVLVSGVILIDVCLMSERIRLIKRKRWHGPGDGAGNGSVGRSHK